MLRIKTFLLLAFLSIQFTFAQFPGTKTKDPYKAFDQETYKVGDVIEFGNPMKGEEYLSIVTYKRKSFFDNVIDVTDALSGEEIQSTKFHQSKIDIKNVKNAEIKFFKYLKDKESGKNIQYAIIKLDNENDLAIALDYALQLGEIKSKNKDFTPTIRQKNSSKDDIIVKSFSPAFNVKILSVNGDINNQTVEITFLISHEIIHQKVCVNYDKNSAKLYDFEGNEYSAKSAAIGVMDENMGLFGKYVCNKIPTNVPVKAKIIFNQILPNKDKMSFCSIVMGYRADDGDSSYKYGNIEITNLQVDWK